MRSARATNVDLEGWACQVREKLTGKPHQRSKSSASVTTPSQQAPPRRMSRIDGPAPPPPRRPVTTVDAASGAKERQNHAQSFPTRTSSHSAPRHPIEDHEKSGPAASSSSAAEQARMMPPPPPKGGRPPAQKAYTESSSTTSLEAQREQERLERERELELQRLHAYKQGTIGIKFEGGGSGGGSTLEKGHEGDGRMPEMKERRRLPPIVAMSNTSNGGLGMKNNSWEMSG